MRLHKLRLENWRGIDSFELDLDVGVTIVEGPNEIGKSTLVEALRLLIRTLDSSKASNVKAIQPVGEDVGSWVEAEIESGGFQFTYAKRFNKSAETTLHITKPKIEQFTGREAHERVEEILKQTMDLALWEALLVDQGKEVAQANLKDSAGLSKSLDEAAGSAATGFEDTGLISIVESEYGKFFTPTGQIRYKKDEERSQAASIVLRKARESLQRVGQDLEAFERCKLEVSRLEGALPDLAENVATHKERWERVRSLQNNLQVKERELKDAQQILEGIEATNQQRIDFIEEIKNGEQRIRDAEQRATPLDTEINTLDTNFKTAQDKLSKAKANIKKHKTECEIATGDRDYFQDREQVTALKSLLKNLKKLAKQKSEGIKTLAELKVDNEVLNELRKADTQLNVLSGQRHTIATTLEIQAKSDLKILVNQSEIKLKKARPEQLEVASKTLIEIPEIVTISITPPKSAEEMDEQLKESQDILAEMLGRNGVDSLSEAIAANDVRLGAERDLERLKDREQHLLDGSSIEEIELSFSELEKKCKAYRKSRPQDPKMPESLAKTVSSLQSIEDQVAADDQSLEDRQLELDDVRERLETRKSDLHAVEQEFAGLKLAVKDKRENIQKARNTESDKILGEKAKTQEVKFGKIKEEFSHLKTDLERASPEATEVKFTNAKQALQRARLELKNAETDLAVLADRLDQARANGKYEAVDEAEREYEESTSVLTSINRRAAAIDLLFRTLNTHRDATRKAYVLPLKDHIEKLGEIVFGADFEVVIDDDWNLKSRTLKGRTIPFDSLSVGTREQMGLITRLAVAQIVGSKEGVPLIIDDALGFSDPMRLESMGAAIAKAGEECQILLLTSSPGRFTHVGNATLVKFS